MTIRRLKIEIASKRRFKEQDKHFKKKDSKTTSQMEVIKVSRYRVYLKKKN